MLTVENVSVSYGAVTALSGCSLAVPKGGIVTLLGANGAGKTTTLHAIAGLQRSKGNIVFDGRRISGARPDEIVRAGLSLVPEHRELFPEMTVYDNLLMGRYIHGFSRDSVSVIDEVFELFPELVEKRTSVAVMLSGGQQQMLAIGRALMAKPRMLLLDEPSIGLAPLMVDRIFRAIREINRRGVTILLVEQNAYLSLPISDTAYVLESGRISLSGTAENLLTDSKVKASYLGVL